MPQLASMLVVQRRDNDRIDFAIVRQGQSSGSCRPYSSRGLYIKDAPLRLIIFHGGKKMLPPAGFRRRSRKRKAEPAMT
jgi:hypothetical protein